MIGRALKIFIALLAVTLIVAALVFDTYTETRPERRILVEENYQPPQRPHAANPVPPAQPSTDAEGDLMTPMPGAR